MSNQQSRESTNEPHGTEQSSKLLEDMSDNDGSDNPRPNLFEQYKNTEIFETRDTLQDSYTPNEINFRDTQRDKLMKRLGRILEGEDPGHAVLKGPNGTGKTLLVDRITNDLKQFANTDLEVVHVNCASCKSESDVATTVVNTIVPPDQQMAETGYSTKQCVSRLFDTLENYIQESTIILVLDDVSRVTALDNILYEISRDQEGMMLDNTHVSAVLTANRTEFFQNISRKVSSSFNYKRIEFQGYSVEELFSILKERADQAFIDGSIADARITQTAALAKKMNGDARYGLEILEEAGEIAELEGASTVTDDHIKEARKEIERSHVSSKLLEYDEPTQLFLACIAIHNTKAISKEPTGANIRRLHRELADRFDMAAYSDTTYSTKFQAFTSHDLIRSGRVPKSSSKSHETVYKPKRYLESLTDNLRRQLYDDEFGILSESDDLDEH